MRRNRRTSSSSRVEPSVALPRASAASTPGPPASGGKEWKLPWWVAGILVVAAVLLYGRCWGHGFIDYDDLIYIVNNPQVSKGMSWDGFCWALTSREHQNWMPLARWSMQIDCAWWGLHAGGHHAMSGLWHGLAAMALWWALRELTRNDLLSFGVALVFVVHPLQVEAVAWAASRKHLLCGLWAFVALGCWCRWWREGGGWMLAGVFGAWALSLAAKQTVVAWPLVFALASTVVPGRHRSKSTLVVLAVAFGLMAVAATGVALWALEAESAQRLPTGRPGEAVRHVPVAFVHCLRGWVAPYGFNYLHVMPASVPRGLILAAAGLLGLITWLVWRLRTKWPLMGVGWGWFLLAFAPTSGIIPFGPQAWAERFAYVALPGLTLAASTVIITWTTGSGGRRNHWVPCAVLAIVLTAGASVTVRQQRFWHDSRRVFERALAVNPANGYARFHLAAWLEKCGFEAESIGQYRQAVERTPDFMPARYNYACASMKRKDPIAALQAIRPVTVAMPQWAEAQLVLANASYETGDAQAALQAYETAARLNPALEIAARNAAVLRERLFSAPPSGTRVP